MCLYTHPPTHPPTQNFQDTHPPTHPPLPLPSRQTPTKHIPGQDPYCDLLSTQVHTGVGV